MELLFEGLEPLVKAFVELLAKRVPWFACTNFASGDRLDFTFTTNATAGGHAELLVNGGALANTDYSANTPLTFTLFSSANDRISLEVGDNDPSGTSLSSAIVTCIPASTNGPGNTSNQNLDSQLLRELQLQLTKTVATNSG